MRKFSARKFSAALAVACAIAAILAIVPTDVVAVAQDAAAQRGQPAAAAGFDVVERSITDLQDAMRSGRVTSRQLVEAYLTRIRKYDQDGPRINAFITLNPTALETADALDAERRTKGPRDLPRTRYCVVGGWPPRPWVPATPRSWTAPPAWRRRRRR